MDRYEHWMRSALAEATQAAASADVPIGAVVFDEAGESLGHGHNERELTGDPLGARRAHRDPGRCGHRARVVAAG